MSNIPIAGLLRRVLTIPIVDGTPRLRPKLDAALNEADSPPRMNQDVSLRRPMDVQDNLSATLGVPLKRLTFRSQPVPSQTQGFETIDNGGVHSEHYDWAYIFFNRDLRVTFEHGSEIYVKWKSQFARYTMELRMTTQVLTILDTAAVLPSSNWSEAVKSFTDVFKAVVESFQAVKKTIWPSDVVEDVLEDRLSRCNTYTFIQRLIFYDARLHGKSLKEYMTNLRQIREEVGIPIDFNLAKEFRDIKILCLERRREIQEAFLEVFELEWADPIIPVTDVSSEIKNPDGMECIICRSDLDSLGLLTVPCRHTYCKDCLEHWIHAAQKSSHMCPYCRTELFPQPRYRPKHMDSARNYAEEIDCLERLMVWGKWIEKSAAWFNAELEMQRVYEEETGVENL